MIPRTAKTAAFLACCSVLVSCGSRPKLTRSGALDSGAPSGSGPGKPDTTFSEARFDFGAVLSGTAVEHEFTLRNRGSAPVVIEKVTMTAPLLAVEMPHAVAAGTEGRIKFKLDTAGLEGKFAGAIEVSLDDPALPRAQLAFSGVVTPAIELTPRPAFFLAGERGKESRAAIEIVNHESEPLRIEHVEHPAGRFSSKLETLKPGQRYRLILALKPDGPGGRSADTILVKTSSKRMPVLAIAANTYLYNRVHAFPDAVDLGSWRASECDRAAATLMVHQEGGSGFRIRVSSDIPGIRFKPEAGPKGDRYQVEVSLAPEKVRPGPLTGSIVIDTNDKEFPRLVVPVSGQIVGR